MFKYLFILLIPCFAYAESIGMSSVGRAAITLQIPNNMSVTNFSNKVALSTNFKNNFSISEINLTNNSPKTLIANLNLAPHQITQIKLATNDKKVLIFTPN